MDTALIGLLGVLIGLLVGERFRRASRIEGYAAEIFARRLKVYEGLYAAYGSVQELGDRLFEDRALTSEERHAIVADEIHTLAGFLDEHAFYIPEDIVMQCMLSIIGLEDTSGLSDMEERRAAYAEFCSDAKSTKIIIREAAGLEAIERTFRSVAKVKPKSRLIAGYKAVRERFERSPTVRLPGEDRMAPEADSDEASDVTD